MLSLKVRWWNGRIGIGFCGRLVQFWWHGQSQSTFAHILLRGIGAKGALTVKLALACCVSVSIKNIEWLRTAVLPSAIPQSMLLYDMYDQDQLRNLSL